MLKLLKKLFLFTAIILFFVPCNVKAMPEIMPLDKVENGMKGVAYTVVDNSGVIESFDVDIVGLMDNGKGSAKMILANASGAVIEKTGGVLQGMSGSPVYVDGKLVGALSGGFKEMSPYTFFITPIESMIKLWDLPDDREINTQKQKTSTAEEKSNVEEKNSDAEKTSTAEENLNTEEKISNAEKNSNTEEKNSDAEKTSNIEATSTLFFSGFDSSGLKFLKREMQPLGFNKFFAAGAPTADGTVKYDATLEPGAAMGVAVVYGDFIVGSTGTVTAVDGKRILGFGHPFTHAGNVNFFLTDSSVVASVSGSDGIGMKVAQVGNIIGRINQDREAGVAGVLGRFPSVVPITVTVNDKSLDKTETYNATIAYNENLVPKLGASIAYTALSKTADSLAESTVTVDFGIKTNVVDSGTLSRQNMFYNTTDVGQVAIVELLQALNIICSNTTEESNIFGIDVNMTMETERKTASLVSAVPDKTKVKPGDTVNLTVTLQPYRKVQEKIVVPYTVPIIAKEGPMTLDLHGGALVPAAQAAMSAVGLITPSTETPAKNYAEKIKNFLNMGKNNQLVVEPGASGVVKSDKEIKADIVRAKKAQERLAKLGKKASDTKPDNKVDTGYIIDNVIQVVINVDKI